MPYGKQANDRGGQEGKGCLRASHARNEVAHPDAHLSYACIMFAVHSKPLTMRLSGLQACSATPEFRPPKPALRCWQALPGRAQVRQ